MVVIGFEPSPTLACLPVTEIEHGRSAVRAVTRRPRPERGVGGCAKGVDDLDGFERAEPFATSFAKISARGLWCRWFAYQVRLIAREQSLNTPQANRPQDWAGRHQCCQGQFSVGDRDFAGKSSHSHNSAWREGPGRGKKKPNPQLPIEARGERLGVPVLVALRLRGRRRRGLPGFTHRALHRAFPVCGSIGARYRSGRGR